MSDSVLHLLRDGPPATECPTMGRFLAPGGEEWETLELPWRHNLPLVSCIPVGTYEIRMTHSTRFDGLMPEVCNVPGRTGIRIHPGVRVENVEGCIATGGRRATPTTLAGHVPAFGQVYAWLDHALDAGRVWLSVAYADGGTPS